MPKRKAAGAKRKKVSAAFCNLCFSTEMFIKRSKTLSKKSYLQLYFTQIVHSNGKMLFLQLNNCLSKFLWRAAHIKLFITSRKSSVFRQASASHLRDVYCLKRSEELVKKIISPVIFDTNRLLKQ